MPYLELVKEGTEVELEIVTISIEDDVVALDSTPTPGGISTVADLSDHSYPDPGNGAPAQEDSEQQPEDIWSPPSSPESSYEPTGGRSPSPFDHFGFLPRGDSTPPRGPRTSTSSSTPRRNTETSSASSLTGSVFRQPGQPRRAKRRTNSNNAVGTGPETIKRRGPTPTQLVKAQKMRSRTARARGDTIITKTSEFVIACGGKAYVKLEYEDGTGAKWLYGTDFNYSQPASLIPSHTHSSAGTELNHASLEGGIRETIRDVLVGTLGAGIAKKALENETAAMNQFRSPRKLLVRTESSFCQICRKKDVVDNALEYTSSWIACEHKDHNTRMGKDNWVHMDCLNFPGATQAEASRMPPYYCKDHKMDGRRTRKVTMKYTSAVPLAGQKKTAPESICTRSGRVVKKKNKDM